MRCVSSQVFGLWAMALTSLPVAARAEPVKPVSLEGTWRFSPIDDPRFARPDWDDAKWIEVQAPKPLKAQCPTLAACNGWYRRKFSLPAELQGADLIFTAGNVSGSCAVYLNGILIGEKPISSQRSRHYAPKGIVRAAGENVLAVRVVSRDGMQDGKIEFQAADEKARKEILSEYIRTSIRFDVHVPPFDAGGQVPVRATVENPGPFNPRIDNAEAQIALRRPGEPPQRTVPCRLIPGREQSFEFPVPSARSEWELAMILEGEEVRSGGFAIQDYHEPLADLAVDPHSLWIKDARGRKVALFAGEAASERPMAPVRRDRPTILNLTNAILWDDYYLPRRRDGNFVEQFAKGLRPAGEVIDASFQSLALLLVPDLQRIILASHPDIIILSVGEHEHFFSPSPADSERAFGAIVNIIRAATTADLVLVTPPPSFRDRAISEPFDQATRRLAKAHGLPLIDTAKVFADSASRIEDLYERLCPNEKAHGLIATELRKILTNQEIKKILKRNEYVRAAPTPEGKTIAIIDGRMPASTDISGNAKWGDAAGRTAHWHEGGKGQSEHSFVNGDPVPIPPGATLTQEVLLDADPKPQSIMLVFRSAVANRDAQGINYYHQHSSEHGVFWGEDLMSYGKGKTGEASHVNGGALPTDTGWSALRVDLDAVGLVGRHLDSVRFVTYGGTARWGKTTLSLAGRDQVWVDGRFPLTGGRGRDWEWVPAPDRPNQRAHRTVNISAERNYAVRFIRAVPVTPGARLRQWVYVPAGQEPSRIALSPGAGGTRIYWGRLKAYDDPGRAWVWGGPMPIPGRWATLELPLKAPLTGLGFLTWTGAALWGPTEIVGVDPAFDLGPDFYSDYQTSQSADAATVGSTAMGNQYFDGQTPSLWVSLRNPTARPEPFRGELQLTDAYDRPVLRREIQSDVPAEGMAQVAVPCDGLTRGFYRVQARDGAGHILSTTTMSVLPRQPNLLDKDLFVYSNSGYVPEELRFYDVLGGKWCRTIAVEQEIFRIEAFDTSPVDGTAGGTDEVIAAYRRARECASRQKSTPHHTQYWFNISSDEMNLKWHNIERWSEVIRAVTIGLKQSDPQCIVSTPEINSIAMGMVEKLGENHTYDYLDLYFSTGCSLPVPPECMNKYWAFDIDALAMMKEQFGRRLTLTGMQYSTGNIGRAWGIHEEHQAAYYVRGDVLRRTRDVDYISYFKFRESPNVNIYEVKDAITHADLTPKPAFVAMALHFAKMNRSRYRGQILAGPGNHVYLFDRPSGPILVLWTTEPVPQKINLNLHAPEVRVTDLYGREQRTKTAAGLMALTVSGDAQYLEGTGPEITGESLFRPAPVLDPRGAARGTLKELFLAVDVQRADALNFGDSRRGGRGDLVMTAGATFPLRVNVYNLRSEATPVEIELSLPGGFEDKTGKQTCDLAAGAAASLWFTVHIPLGRKPGADKIRALGRAKGVELDPFTTDILVRSPLEILPLDAVPKPGTALRVRFTNATDAPVDAQIRLDLPMHWRTDKPDQALSQVPPGQSVETRFALAAARVKPFHEYSVAAFAKVANQEAELPAALDLAAVQPTQHPVMLDGQLDEWFASGPVDGGQRSNDYIYNQFGQILDPLNFHLGIRTQYDAQCLYLALDVWDDHICEEDTKHGLLWDLDSVQISFDVDGDGKGDEQVSVSCTGRSYITPSDPRGDREPMITGSKGLVEMASRLFLEPTASHPRGSTMELAIPWAYFQKKPFVPQPGARLGIHVFCVDEDVRAWSARPWKFDEGRTPTFLPFVLGAAVDGVTPSDWKPVRQPGRKVFSRSPGDIAASQVKEAGLLRGNYYAGNAERFPTTGLDAPDRSTAQRLWFYGPGFIEYEYDLSGWKVPDRILAVEFAAELATCYRPGNTHYALPGNPTRVQIRIGTVDVGACDLLGDPGVDGWLVRLRVTDAGTFHRSERISAATLTSLRPQLQGKVRVRLTATGLGGSPGGLNVHGPNGSGIHGIDPSLIVVSEP